MKALACALFLSSLFGALPLFAQDFNLADLQARVAKNDPEAELDLGRAYHLGGHGVVKDFAKAADLYRKAAAHGNAKAMYNLGYIYHHGQGVGTDDSVAAQWFEKAAEKGLPAAELEVGLAYYHGENGVKQDYLAAAKWLSLAAQQEDSPAQSGPAANALGSLYEHGWGVPQDGKLAVSWYSKGADLGDAKAQFNLARLYETGELVKRDLAQVYKWLKLASFQGDQLAIHLMSEDLGNNHFTAAQIAEGDRLAAEYQSTHHKAPLKGPVPTVIEPESMGLIPKKPKVQAGAGNNAPGTGTATLAPSNAPANAPVASPGGASH
jgi:hypothetical protein